MTRPSNPILILAFIILLAACGSTASSVTPAASSATPTATAAALVKGEFAGDAGQLAAIGLSTNGRQVTAYLCNGTARHVSLEQWFTGPVTSNDINITNAHGAHLVATTSAQAITGTVTLKDGRSSPFTARLLPPGSPYGLYRSEETFNGVHYLGGFIVNRQAFGSPPAGSQASLAAAVFPLMIGPEPEWRGGIINEQTGALIAVPPMSASPPMGTQFTATVPGLGTFLLTQCHAAHC
jgi:hypothetical protein